MSVPNALFRFSTARNCSGTQRTQYATIITIAIHADLSFAGLLKMTQWGIYWQMQTVAETPTFSRQADKLFNEHERRDLIELLAQVHWQEMK